MTVARDGRPAGRYGRGDGTADARTDRRLKVLGGVLGALALVVTGWWGVAYITSQRVNAELIAFTVVSDERVRVRLEVRKDRDTAGVCTLRSQAEDGSEVGRADFPVREHADRVDKIVTLRTITRATSAELLGCQTADRG